MRKESLVYNLSTALAGEPTKHKMATKHIHEQECIPVGCVPPALNRRGVSLTETPCGQTDACENITLPQISFVGGNNGWCER